MTAGRRGRGWPIALLACLPILTAGAAASAQDERPLSPAQVALFETDHLKAIQHPERLEYRFQRESTAGAADPTAAYADRVDLDVRPRDDGKKNVWVDFLSGDRHMPFPPLMGFNGNPVLMFFLEHDVEEMNQTTGGAATYFRNRIRQALVDRAQVKPVEIQRDGAAVAATEITLVPFKDDPNLAAFPGVPEKRYRFLISDTVPGSIYEIEATTPGADGGAPRLKDSMTFESEKPCASGEGPCAPPGSP